MKVNDYDSSVELSVTVWERTWRDCLTPDHFRRIESDVGRSFDRVTVTVNNVDDPGAVRARMHELVTSGVVDGFVEVAHALPDALAVTGLKLRDLEPLEHYTDHFLVKVCQPGPRFLLHWDTDVRLDQSCDWVTPGIDYLQRHREVAVVSVGWPDTWSMDAERLSIDGDFDLGYGFTDHLFLVERRRFARRIYRRFAPAAWWYPTSFLTAIFEQRVDAWMRRERLQRATYREVRYRHDEVMVDHPPRTFFDRVRRRARRHIASALEAIPGFNPSIHRRPRNPSPHPPRKSEGDSESTCY